MPFDGSGVFRALPPPTYPAVPGETIRADYFNAVVGDIMTGLTQVNTGAVTGLATPSGASLIGFQQAGAGSVASTVQNKLRELVSVLDFDADKSGVASSVAAYQTAINSTADGQVVLFLVPSGTYKGDFSGLTFGTRTVVWLEAGAVTYTILPPPGQRMLTAIDGTNRTRAWLSGAWGFSDDSGKTTGTTADQPRVYVVRNAQHTGGVAGANPSALSVQSTIGANVKNYEAALTVRMDESSTGDATIGPNFVGAQIVGARHTPHTQVARTYGLNIVANDLTTRGAIDGINMGGLIPLEVDIRASGPDTEAVRHGIYIQPSGLGGSPDGADGMASCLLMRLASTGALTTDACIRIDDIGSGGSNSFNIGLYALAQINSRLIDMRSTTAQGVARFGSTLNSGMPGSVQLVGNSSTGAERIYGEIAALITNNTNTAESGALQFRPIVAGATVNAMQVGDGVIVGNPVGSYKGAGTINVQNDLYKNNTAYGNPDYVFEHAYTGQIVKFANNEGANAYGGRLSLEATEQITRDTFKLPGMGDEPLGMFGRADRLLQLLEEAYLHIFDLNARLKKGGL